MSFECSKNISVSERDKQKHSQFFQVSYVTSQNECHVRSCVQPPPSDYKRVHLMQFTQKTTTCNVLREATSDTFIERANC